MALAQPRTHTHTNRTPPDSVTTAEYQSVLGTAGAPTYFDAGAPRGVVVNFAEWAAGAGTSILAEDGANDTKFGQLTFRIFFTAAPSAATQVAEIRSGTPGSNSKIANFLVGASAGAPYIKARGGADANLTGWEANTVLALNTWYTVQMAVEVGTTTSNGKTMARITRDSDQVVLAQGAGEALNAGTANVVRYQLGKLSATIGAPFYIDDVAWWDSAYAYLDPAQDVTLPNDPEAGNLVEHTFVGKTAGAPLDVDEFTQVYGSPTFRFYHQDEPGNLVARFSGDTTAAGFVEDAHPTSGSKLSWAGLLNVRAFPDVLTTIMNQRASNNTNLTALAIYPNGTLRVNNGDGTQSVMVTPVLSTDTWYLLQVAVTVGTTASNGKIRARVTRVSDSVVLAEQERSDISNATGVGVSATRFGKQGTAVTLTVDFDNIRSRDGSYGFIPAAEPASYAGPDQTVEPLTTVTLTGFGPGSWSQVSGPVVTLAGSGTTRTFTTPIGFDGATLVFAYGTDQMSVVVLPATEGILPPGASEWVPVVWRAGGV